MPFDASYFSTNTYKNVSFARFSQYWWSNRFYAILARRYGQRGAHLLEIGSGLGHLVGQLENHFQTFAVDVNHWALEQSFQVSSSTFHVASGAEELPFGDNLFAIVIIKHVVEHLPHPERAIAEISRVTAPGGTLILSTPNLASLLKPLKGEKWIGYLDPTHISLESPAEWLEMIKSAGFTPLRIFADGFWDAPYIPVVPKVIQKLFFGSLGGFQAMTGFIFLPLKWGESMMVVARKSQ
jgi:2-polyprenyl-3-methyl-5-hydroxy-6-metoxy-1,4-benzoquinol methylase